MSILFKRGVVALSVLTLLTLLGTTYVGAISTARPVVISRPPVVKSTPVAKPVTKSSTPKSSTSKTKSLQIRCLLFGFVKRCRIGKLL